MAKTISNTLTRWHKVAERLKVGAAKVKAENLSALMAGERLDADMFRVRKAALMASTDAVLGARTDVYMSLQNALFLIRRRLSATNSSAGVSDLLVEMEAAKQRAEYYEALVETADGNMSAADYEALATAKRTAPVSSVLYGVGMTFISAEKLAGLVEMRDQARRDINAYADRLSDANATKLSIELDDEVVAFLGM